MCAVARSRSSFIASTLCAFAFIGVVSAQTSDLEAANSHVEEAASPERPASSEGVPFSSVEIRRAIADLGAVDWEIREAAQRDLVLRRSEWLSKCPIGWRPEDPEAAYRFQWVLDRAIDLDRLEVSLLDDPDGGEWTVRKLHRELGPVVVDGLVETFGRSTIPRVRRRVLIRLRDLDVDDLVDRIRIARDDVSPWVRRAYYELVGDLDREILVEDVRHSLGTEGDDARWIEAARAIGVHGLTTLHDELRSHWESASVSRRRAIARSIARRPSHVDRAILLWGARSEHYALAIDALRALEHVAEPSDIEALLDEGIGTDLFDVEARLLSVVESRGDASLALELLPLLESTSPSNRRRVARLLIDWRAFDYFLDIELAQAEWSEEDRVDLTARR